MINIAENLSKIDWDFPNSNTNGNINSIHPYPAKFIEEIPRSLIEILGVPEGTWILDPFCGSGSTLVEAQIAGIPSIGVDLNPIACLISRVKTQPLQPDFVELASELVCRARQSNEVNIPRIPNIDHWFNLDVQETIARLLAEINNVEEKNTREALQLSLSSILVRASNQESDTRYAAIIKNIDNNKVYQLFLDSTKRLVLAKSKYFPKTEKVNVICKDILQTTTDDLANPIGLVITSPPYPNAYEYWLYHKYRMFWLGFNPLEVKDREIGARAHYFKKNYPSVEDFRNQMRSVFGLLWANVITGGHVCFVIGRSMIHGNIIDNSSILIEIAHELGFSLVANLSRHISSSRKTFNLSHANIKTENILVFRK